jgi:hypothetical protein
MAGNHVLLETISLTQTATSVVFDNIPQTGYTDLKIDFSIRTSVSQINDNVFFSFNGSTSNFSARWFYGGGTSGVGNSTNARIAGFGNGNTATADTFGSSSVYISNYTSGNNKPYLSDAVLETNGGTAYQGFISGLWSNSSAITSITLTPESGPNFLAGSTFSLYGVAALGTTPTVAPKATGGNIVANDGTYWYHAFISSGSFIPQIDLTCDVLQVAGGGGGGGYDIGAGGGAGGLLAFSSQNLTPNYYNITVGAGGATYANGSNSQFASLTASVGGGGGGHSGYSGLSGGSGGGAGKSYLTSPVAGSASPAGQGNNGGGITYNSDGPTGGGGGATAVGGTGGSGSTGVSGNGGAGSSAYSSWGAATLTGQNVSGTYWFAGGGGGGARSGGTAGTGGNGGGRTGTAGGGTPSPATANTGGGGGGGALISSTQYPGGNGGSGVVIIRYAMV